MFTVRKIREGEREKLISSGFSLPEKAADENILVGIFDDEIIGFACHDYSDGQIYDNIVVNVFVAEGYRRRGYGTELFYSVCRLIDTRKYDILSDKVFDDGSGSPGMGFAASLNAEDWQALYLMEYTGEPYRNIDESHIIPYRDEFFDELDRIKYEAWQPLGADYGFKLHVGSEETRREWHDDKANAFVYMLDGKPVALASCGTDSHMHGLFVSPKCSGRGIGKLLVQYCTNEVFRRGYKKATLSVLSRNPAMRIYEKLGFRICGTEHYYRVKAGNIVCGIENNGK